MNNVIIVFERPDIPSALSLAAQTPDAEIWVFDPHLLDDLAAVGAINCRFICDIGLDMPSHIKVTERQTLSVIQRVDSALEQSVPDALGCNWQYLNLFHQLLTINSHALLWDKFLQVSPDATFHILVNDTPAKYYAPSFLPALMLLERLSILQIPFAAYSYNRLDDDRQLIPKGDIFSSGSGPYRAFVHLPTSIYDARFFEEEINAAGPNVLNFQSMNWNVTFPSLPSVGLCWAEDALAQLTLAQQTSIAETMISVTAILTQIFSGYLKTEDYVIRQVKSIAKQYEAQIIFYLSLVKEFSSSPPKKIILSNHDAGLQGPFTSFAKKYDVSVVLLPHAKIFNWPIASSYSNTIALTHPLLGGVITDIGGKRVVSHLVAYPERQFNAPSPVTGLKTVGLLLNKFSSDGYSLIDTTAYLLGLSKIIDWCKAHGIECKLRVKPGGTCINWLVEELGIDAYEIVNQVKIGISDFAQSCDICLMYDCPTSGAIDFLRQSVPIISTVFRPLCATEAALASLDIIPKESVDEALQQLDLYRINPSELFVFRMKQFSHYTASFEQSLPLRLFV